MVNMYAPDTCDVSVVLPIFNEKGHLRTEIDRIRTALSASRYSFEIIVVDDGSNDGSQTELASIEGDPVHEGSRSVWAKIKDTFTGS